MEEYLDVLNEKGEKTGGSRTYGDTHLNGLVHSTVHVWFVNSKKQFLMQKRKKDRRAFPSFWDMAVGGHVSAGDTSLETAIKETKEELGIDLPSSAFTLLCLLKQPIVIHDKNFIDNEFNYVYLVHSDLSLSEFQIQVTEVEEIKWIDKKELDIWINGKGEKLIYRKEEYDKIFESV